MAAGTLTPGTPPCRGSTWAEDTGSGKHAIFVSRLVGGDHFELFNGGAPVSAANRDAAQPGHHVLRQRPVRVVDRDRTATTTAVSSVTSASGCSCSIRRSGSGWRRTVRRAPLIDARVPLSSSCTADPFTNDGSACPIAARSTRRSICSPPPAARSGCSARRSSAGSTTCCSRDAGWSLTSRTTASAIDSSLGQSNNVGILVQRVVGSKRVHGERVLVLRKVGRVPLGLHHKGRVKIHWNLKVNGHRLEAGRYRSRCVRSTAPQRARHHQAGDADDQALTTHERARRGDAPGPLEPCAFRVACGARKGIDGYEI